MSGIKDTISVADFGALPGKKNNALELRNAVEACRGHKNKTLLIPPGVYHFSDPKAVEFRDKIMMGKFGNRPEKKMFFPYAPYVKGLDFAHCEDLTINAEGALILFDGWLEPISLEHCRNIIINGLSLDYLRKPFSEGKVIKRSLTSFEVQIDSKYPVQKGVPCPRVEFWDNTHNQLSKQVTYTVSSKLIAPQIIRIIGKSPSEPGEILAMIVHSFHFRPAILIHEAENVVLNNVSIHAQPGMGIVGHRCHNLTFNKLQILPTNGARMSTNTDATHFTSCTGLIRFDNCHIESQGDDSTNIHNYYYTITKKIKSSSSDDRIVIRVDAPTGTHAQVLDYPDVGDILELVESDSLNPVNTFKVLNVQNFPQKWKSEITLQGHLPKDFKHYLLANITRLPQVIIQNNHFGNHVARGMLIKTRNVLIENNFIENTTGVGIHVGAEASWREGVTSADVIIRKNKIFGCGTGGSSGITFNIDTKNRTAIGAHKRITIQDNQIKGEPNQIGITISNAEDIILENNDIQGCQTGISIQYSRRIEITKNAEIKIEIGKGTSEVRINKKSISSGSESLSIIP